MATSYNLSILVPVYNEERTLERLLGKLAKVKFQSKVHVIIVNDGSKDKSQEIIDGWIEQNHPFLDIEVITHKKNRGKGAGIQTGLKVARGKYFVIQDADLEYDPAEIPTLLKEALKTGAPVIYGSRFLGEIRNMAKPNYLGNRTYNILISVLYGVHMTDMHTCYKMLDTKLFRSLRIQSQGFAYATEVISKLLRQKIPIKEMPISFNGRTVKEGKKINIKDGVECLTQIIYFRFESREKLLGKS
ncbi:glycosyltransferase family 2 protein [soil metagenome]